MNNATNPPILVISSTNNAVSKPRFNALAYHKSNNSPSSSIDGSSKLKEILQKQTEPLKPLEY